MLQSCADHIACFLQFSVKHTQELDCGGAYLKLLPTSRYGLRMLAMLDACMLEILHR